MENAKFHVVVIDWRQQRKEKNNFLVISNKRPGYFLTKDQSVSVASGGNLPRRFAASVNIHQH